MKYLSRNLRLMAAMAVCMSAMGESSAGGTSRVTQETLDADSARVGTAQATEDTAALNLTTAQADLERDTASFNAEVAAVAAHPVLGTFDKIEAYADTLVEDVRTVLNALVDEGRALVNAVLDTTPAATEPQPTNPDGSPIPTPTADASPSTGGAIPTNLGPNFSEPFARADASPAVETLTSNDDTTPAETSADTDGSTGNADITSNGSSGSQ